jgi:hypothetical protein
MSKTHRTCGSQGQNAGSNPAAATFRKPVTVLQGFYRGGLGRSLRFSGGCRLSGAGVTGGQVSGIARVWRLSGSRHQWVSSRAAIFVLGRRTVRRSEIEHRKDRGAYRSVC